MSASTCGRSLLIGGSRAALTDLCSSPVGSEDDFLALYAVLFVGVTINETQRFWQKLCNELVRHRSVLL